MNRRKTVFKFLIQLEGILPPVWREILVPATYSFWDLHVAIQDSMGWLDCHLHEFRFGNSGGSSSVLIGIPPEEIWEDTPEVLAGWEIPITDFFTEVGDRADYEYDFGDGWQHEVTLLASQPREKGGRYPQCPAGERACPPEDCGGIHGYQNLVDALLDPGHAEHHELSAWIPDGWGPEVFRAELVRFDNPRRRWEGAFLGE